jgi:RhtB (resistance to homoserine/threonine) family protein
MIDPKALGLFLAAAFAVILAPGPDILYVLSRSMSGGRRVGLVSALGISFGEIAHTVLAVLGLAAILQASIAAFLVMKWLGAVYLIYLGFRTLCERNEIAFQHPNPARLWTVFRQGLLTNLFNPKAILFYVTFLPQFVNPAREHPQFQLFVLGLIFAVLDVIFLAVLARCAAQIGAWLVRKPKTAVHAKCATGTVLIGLGVRLAFAKRN